ncbi:MAG: hypothetical protein LAP38_17070 [Acidobacteriia bacterium]|nr:hypothetical protein [Terriglobia bacterium]
MKSFLLSMLFACSATLASATSITVLPETSTGNAVAARNAWILSTLGVNWNPVMLENFEGFGYGPYNSLSTGAGTFSVAPGSQAGDPQQSNGTHTDQFTILNSSDTPFSGRFNTTSGGSNWLDSNDITRMQLTTSASTLFFFITDVGDCGGVLQIQTADGTTYTFPSFSNYAGDGNLYFVGINSASSIGSVKWLNNSGNDGFGMDDFGTAVDPPPPPPAVPEPASWPVAAAGLLAIPLIRKFRSRSSRSPETSA